MRFKHPLKGTSTSKKPSFITLMEYKCDRTSMQRIIIRSARAKA